MFPTNQKGIFENNKKELLTEAKLMARNLEKKPSRSHV